MNSAEIKVITAVWQDQLDLSHFKADVVNIDSMQVVDDNGCPGNELVGVVSDYKNKSFTIYHTRSLEEEDVVHELLHVKHPTMDHNKIESLTELLIDRRNNSGC